MAVGPPVGVPDTITVHGPDGTTKVFALNCPPDCIGFVFTYRVNETVRLTYDCNAVLEELDTKGQSDESDKG